MCLKTLTIKRMSTSIPQLGNLTHRFALKILLQLRDETSRLQDLEHVRRERCEFQHHAGRNPDVTAGEVELDHVARLHTFTQAGALDHWEPEVVGVPEEDARESGRENRGDAEGLQSDRCLLPARAAAEVRSRDDHVPGPDVPRPRRVDGLEGVLREHLRIRGPQVLACDDVVGRDVVAERPHAALEAGLHDRYAFRGSVISPWIADAVTVHGLARYTCAVGEPIRPG